MDPTTFERNSSTEIPSMENNPSSNASVDQVSSLREAALSTLRAKRRKPGPGLEKVPLSRPPPPESIQLDYGQEESSQEPSQPPMKREASRPLDTAVQSSAKRPEPPSEDLQMREEGEISEEEDVAPPPKAPKLTCKSPAADIRPPPAMPSTPSRRYSVIAQDKSSKQSRRLSGQSPTSPLSPGHRSSTPSVQLSAAQLALLTLDANNIRPGLQMTQQQYETAKDIILDLLGWGVPPEYLVECGLSRELVFYVFAELNLRLPRNLDTTGLISYTQEAVASARQAAASAKRTEVTSPRSPTQAQSPAKVVNDASHQLKPTQSPSSPVAMSLSSSSNLHDIEMQRRQELLARKRAALASRKSRQTTATTLATAASQEGSVAMTTAKSTSAATDDVDSFLKSISASKVANVSTSASPSDRATSLPKSDDAMDVDDIPGLGKLLATRTETSPSCQSSILQSPRPSKEPPQSEISPIESLTENFPHTIEKADSTSSLDSFVSATPSATLDNQARRGAKRPVASDFVDLDTNTRLPTTNGSKHDHGSTYLNPHSKRKSTVVDFGSVNNGHRRCVIDLSDSEEESEEFRREYNHRRRGQRGSFITPPSSSTPPFIPATPLTPGGVKEPSHLEMEIQRMKELIAKKEQDRLRKLASRVQISHEVSILKVKQEEIDLSLHPKPPTMPNDDPYHESSDASIASVAAALGANAGASTPTTPVIDDGASVQDASGNDQLIDAKPGKSPVARLSGST